MAKCTKQPSRKQLCSGTGKLRIVYRPIGHLKADRANPRIHSERQIRQIATSIQTFGITVPALVDKDLQLIAGHGRIQACKILGIGEVPTISLDHLTKAQAKAYLIADNRLTENAEWDDRLLGEQLKTLASADLDFSLEVTGFEIGEIDAFIEGLANNHEEGSEDVVSSSEPLPAVSRIDDLWILGNNKVACGDALKRSTYTMLMTSQKANVVFADIPYNVPIAGHVSGLGKTRHREFVQASGEMDEEAFTKFSTTALQYAAQFSVDGSIHFICIDWRHLRELLSAGTRVYSQLKNLCVWTKDNAGMGSFYRSQHELVLVFKSGKASHRNNFELGQHGRYRTNVWAYAGANSFSRNSEEGNLLALHPTVKPVALVADAILDVTKRGDLVLDPFLGSGTSVIAAERTGRVCSGIELDPLYVDTAIRRWQRFTGKSAVHAVSGRTFDELEKEVANV